MSTFENVCLSIGTRGIEAFINAKKSVPVILFVSDVGLDIRSSAVETCQSGLGPIVIKQNREIRIIDVPASHVWGEWSDAVEVVVAVNFLGTHCSGIARSEIYIVGIKIRIAKLGGTATPWAAIAAANAFDPLGSATSGESLVTRSVCVAPVELASDRFVRPECDLTE